MLSKATILIIASVVCFPLLAVTSSDFEKQVGWIRQNLASGDFRAAAIATISLRKNLVSLRDVPRNHPAARDAMQQGFTASAAISQIQTAQDRFHSGDLRGSAQALDIATMLVAGLEGSQDPTSRYPEAMRALASENVNKNPSVSTLHYAARSAYDLNRYSESISLVQRELNALEGLGTPAGHQVHVAHTLLGLNYAGLGNDAGALAELKAAGSVPADMTFRIGPSMALALKLLPKYPEAVSAYLDQCSRIHEWPGAAKAASWKQQVENAQTPDFGSLAVGIVWR